MVKKTYIFTIQNVILSIYLFKITSLIGDALTNPNLIILIEYNYFFYILSLALLLPHALHN